MTELPSTLSLEPIKRVTATEEVTRRLIGLINSGGLKPGDRLPPERALAAQLQVGRTTIREALKLLTLSGLLEARRGSGTFVRENYFNFVAHHIHWPTLLRARDVDLIFEVREALEVQTARLAAERATPEETEAIAVYRNLLELGARDVQRETEIDIEFHRAIAIAAHSDLLLQLLFSVEDLLREYIALSTTMTDNVRSTVQEHEAVFEAIRSRDPEAAARAMARHLAISRTWIVKTAAVNGREMQAADAIGDRDELSRTSAGRD